MLFKETQPILPISFIWKKYKKIGTLGRMLKSERGHVQVFKQSTLECGQGENETQDLEQTPVHKKEGRIA